MSCYFGCRGRVPRLTASRPHSLCCRLVVQVTLGAHISALHMLATASVLACCCMDVAAAGVSAAAKTAANMHGLT